MAEGVAGMTLQTEPWGIETAESWAPAPIPREMGERSSELDECPACYTSWDADEQPDCPCCGRRAA